MFRYRFTAPMFFEELDKGGGDGDDKARRNLQNLLAKKDGDAIALAGDLLAENADLRGKNRELKTKVTPDGAVILSADDAAKWTAFNELGTPDDVKRRLDGTEAIATENADLKAEKVIAQAAALSGFKPDVLADLAKTKGFTLAVEGEGESARVLANYKEGEADASKPLSEYASEKLAAYLPSLQAAEIVPQKPAVAFPRGAAPGGGSAGKNVWDKIREEKKAKVEAADASTHKPNWTEKVGVMS